MTEMEAELIEFAAGRVARAGVLLALLQKYGIWAVAAPFAGWVVIALGVDAWQERHPAKPKDN